MKNTGVIMLLEDCSFVDVTDYICQPIGEIMISGDSHNALSYRRETSLRLN